MDKLAYERIRHPTPTPDMTWVANRKQLIKALRSRQNHPSPRMQKTAFTNQRHPFQYGKQYQQNQPSASQCNLINALENRSQTFTPSGVYRTPAQRRQTQICAPLRRPKGPCYNCGAMGHYTTECDQYEGPSDDYMDEETFPIHPDDQSSEMSETPDYMNNEDPEMDQIPGPTIRPQINLAQIGAQMNTLTNEEYSELIQRM